MPRAYSSPKLERATQRSPAPAHAIKNQRYKIQKAHPQLNLSRKPEGKWTGDEEHLLKGLARDGFTIEEITESMNAEEDFKPRAQPFTMPIVSRRLLKSGLSYASTRALNRSWTQEQNEWLVAMVCDKPLEEPAMTDDGIGEFLELKFRVPFEANWVREQINELKKINELTAISLS